MITNPFAVAVTECMLSANPQLRFHSANTAFKAEKHQPVYVDVHFDFLKVPFGRFVNINLIDGNAELGPTELWLGGHFDTSWKKHVERVDLLIHSDILGTGRKTSAPVL
jgi:hypothetical protein